MIASFKPCRLRGSVDAPPSKSMAHRMLIGAALAEEPSVLIGIDQSEDVLATLHCLRALGASIDLDGDRVTVDPRGFMKAEHPVLDCRESGSTLRFLIPLCLCLGKEVTLRGSRRLMERPLGVYEALCRDRGFDFFLDSSTGTLTLRGDLGGGRYLLRGDVSSQFITGLLFALVYLREEAWIEILPPLESRSYVELTLSALRRLGARIDLENEGLLLHLLPSSLGGYHGRIEGDYSNAAFLDALNLLGSEITVGNLRPDSLQGDRVYADCFRRLNDGCPTLDLSDCPDLGPILFALAALKNGAVFTGIDRLRLKESDRITAMADLLGRLSGDLLVEDNRVTVPKQTLRPPKEPLPGHNDHRIVMAASVILSVIGGSVCGAEAVNKSYPGFFRDLLALGAEVTLYDR